MRRYIHQIPAWPNFYWDQHQVLTLLAEVKSLQGRVLGRMESLGFELQNEANLENLTLDILKSSEIEGELLDLEQVRSSLARRLGITLEKPVRVERDVEGIVELMLDATQNCYSDLSSNRLFDWHASLFPTGRSGMYKIEVGVWRNDSTGPMQVVSGAMGKEKVHFEAPHSDLVSKEMDAFLSWFNQDQAMDILLKASIAHLWFLTVHPFEDGNGRIARALTDMLLARSDHSSLRFYSMSAQIRLDRKYYYEVLEQTQCGNLDITQWNLWFLNCLKRAFEATLQLSNRVMQKAEFWRKNATTVLNERQVLMLNKLLDGFEGKLSSRKWAIISKCSKDTAVRDINDLIQKNVLQKDEAGGRSSSYLIVG
jgi:Fic family protein